MNRILRRRFPREIRANLFRYLSLLILIAFCMYIIIALIDAAETIIQGTEDAWVKTHVEDGQVTVFTPLTDSQIGQIEDAGVTIEEHISFEEFLDDGSVLRIFRNRDKIDTLTLDEGREAKAENEIVLEKRYSEVHELSVGDVIRMGGRDITITGIGSTVDYDAVLRKFSDTAIDSRLFGTAFMTPAGYDMLKSSGDTATEDLTYAFVLNDTMSPDELKQMIKDFEFDYKKVGDKYYRELLDDTYGKRDEIEDGIKELKDGVGELKDGVKELRDGTGDFKDGLKELYDGSIELRDGTGELKDGVKELADGVDELYDGSIELNDGTKDMQDGAHAYWDGIGDLKQGINALDDALDELESNNGELTGGAEKVFDGVLSMAEGNINDSIDNINSSGMLPSGYSIEHISLSRSNYAEVLNGMAEQMGELGADTSKIQGLRSSLDGIASYVEGTKKYTDAVGQIASGACELNAGANGAVDGAYALEQGATALHDGTVELADGVNELKDGTDELKDGVNELYDGAGELADGAKEGYDSSIELDDGVAELADGVDELYDGVDELKEQSDEMLDEIFSKAPDNITSFVLKDENIRIGGAAGDVEINKQAGAVAGVIIIILFTYVLSVFVIHQIQNESSVIGTLYALGVKKRDLVRHYITIPTMISLIGGLIGAAAGFSRFGCEWQMADSYNYYSIPVFDKVIPAYLIIYSVVMPPVVSLIVNTLVINKRLSNTALSLIRNEQKAGKGKNINLGRLSFLNRFKIRQMLREKRTAFTVIFGMLISLLIFMLGMDCYVLCESVGRLNSKDTRYEYMYTYKYPTKEVPEGGEACYINTLKKSMYGYNLDITVIGIDDDNPYYDVETVKGKNKIVASDAITTRYKVGIGDKIIFSDNAEGIDYAFTIADVVPYSVGLSVFMDIDSMRELFGEEDDYYNVVLSDHELDIEQGRLYSTLTKEDVDKAANIFIDLMAPMVVMMISVSIVIFCVVMYLMMAVMIDRSSFGISLVKIFGYNTKEIKKLYLDGNRIVVMIGALVSIPIAKAIMDALFPSFVGNVACPVHLEFKWYYYLTIFAAIMLCYTIINILLTRKLNKVSPAEVLKNRE